MPSTMTLTLEQYEALVSLAQAGASTAESTRRLNTFLQDVERLNGIVRSTVWVQWQEQDAPLPAGTDFPDTWPPEWRRKIQLVTRPVSRSDVESVIARHALRPTNILVSRDPAGILGYTTMDDMFTV